MASYTAASWIDRKLNLTTITEKENTNTGSYITHCQSLLLTDLLVVEMQSIQIFSS